MRGVGVLLILIIIIIPVSLNEQVTLLEGKINNFNGVFYFLSFFRAPRRVVDKLVCIQRRFLWGGRSRPTQDCLGQVGDSVPP